MYNHRVCFLKNGTVKAKVPIFKEIDYKVTIVGTEDVELTKEMVIDKLVALNKLFPNKLPHLLMRTPFMKVEIEGFNDKKEICPIGLFDYEAEFYVSLETAAGKYHTLPYDGGYMEQPLLITEAFDVARSAEARYNNAKMNEINSKIKDKKN